LPLCLILNGLYNVCDELEVLPCHSHLSLPLSKVITAAIYDMAQVKVNVPIIINNSSILYALGNLRMRRGAFGSHHLGRIDG